MLYAFDILAAFLAGACVGLVVGGCVRWGVIAADFRRRFWGDGPNHLVWWGGWK